MTEAGHAILGVVKEGLPFIVISWLIFFAFFIWGHPVLYLPFLALSILVTWFFRDPEREFEGEKAAIVAPADGKVVDISITDKFTEKNGEPMKRVSIFMSVFDVHVNRSPYDGQIERIQYFKGKFLAANLDKSSEDNERNWITIKISGNHVIHVVQIAGIIARRISCWVKETQPVKRGERIGLIRFGSRVDLYLPQGVDIMIKTGDRTKAGKTIVGYIK